MKIKFLIPILCMAIILTAACGEPNDDPAIPEHVETIEPSDDEEQESSDEVSLDMDIVIGNHTITATMENNVAARDLISRLPLEITLNDFNNTTEKIFYPKPALTLIGVPRGCSPVPGDITIYAPWGNVAIFCKEWPHSDDLIKIGHINGNGINHLSVDGDIKVTFKISKK